MSDRTPALRSGELTHDNPLTTRYLFGGKQHKMIRSLRTGSDPPVQVAREKKYHCNKATNAGTNGTMFCSGENRFSRTIMPPSAPPELRILVDPQLLLSLWMKHNRERQSILNDFSRTYLFDKNYRRVVTTSAANTSDMRAISMPRGDSCPGVPVGIGVNVL